MADTTRNQEEQDIRIEMMAAQRDMAQRQFKWETLKAVAIIGATTAGMAGAMITVAHWWHPDPAPPTFPAGTVITIPPAKP